MATTPPEQTGGPTGTPGPGPGYGWSRPGGPAMGAWLPVPGNAELLVLVVLLIIIAIVAGIADDVDSHAWVVAATWLGAAYIISRGIAKASRVLEH